MKRILILVALCWADRPGCWPRWPRAKSFERSARSAASSSRSASAPARWRWASAFVSVADDATADLLEPGGHRPHPEERSEHQSHDLAGGHLLHPGSLRLPHAVSCRGRSRVNARSLYMDAQPVRTVFRPDGEGQSRSTPGTWPSASRTPGRSPTSSRPGSRPTTSSRPWRPTPRRADTFDFGTLYDTGYRSAPDRHGDPEHRHAT